MATPLVNLALVVQQLPLLAKVVQPEVSHAQNQKEIFDKYALEAQLKQKDQVKVLDPGEGPKAVDEQPREEERPSHFMPRQRKAAPEPKAEEPVVSNASPFSGNLLNLKI